MVLGPVQVEDAASRNAQSHDIHLSTSPTTSVQDTPQAVTVIDAQTMKEQGTTTLGDALRNVPGITIAIGEGGTLAGDQFKINGFDAKDDVYLDGLRDFAAYTRDSFDYEEVQVLKGPSGLMFGRGTTGGAINTVTKTAHLGDKYTGHVEVGNGDHYRATADLNYELSDTAAVRLNLMETDTGVVDRDLTHSWRWGIAPVGRRWGWAPTPCSRFNYIHQHTDNASGLRPARGGDPDQRAGQAGERIRCAAQYVPRLQHRPRQERCRHLDRQAQPCRHRLADAGE